ncbi:Heterokaryon incompatibility protein 6, OR allele [Cytospora mali]|uniref:Heterokaryon incompatibility protein 6, OR allele n=1 Tax=Cytospora mali TaxID=578113 RepID=A0A194W4C1_CYTMA|nr:Heterokaryon incompatibility protein 6, OR allele [Valsa mali]
MSPNSITKHNSGDEDRTEACSTKHPSIQSRKMNPNGFPCNSSKRRNAEGVDSTYDPSPKRTRLSPKKTNLVLDTKPSRSIPPPDRPGSLQVTSASKCDDVRGLEETNEVLKANNIYTYQPLQPGEIRLLLLHPGRDNDDISCSLVTESAHAPCAYEALSYVWGDPIITRRITLSDEDNSVTSTKARPHLVGVNLFDALLALRLQDRPLVLWIDALCINQCNDEEKCVQVAMMSTIYKNAFRVLTWLGPPDPHSDLVFLNFHRVFSPGFFSSHGHDSRADNFRELTPSKLWNSFSHLFSRPYWSRKWILQEVALALETVVVCGQLHVNLEDLRTATELFVQWHATGNSTISEFDWLVLERAMTLLYAGTDLLRRSVSGKLIHRKHSLAELVLRFRDFRATDSRDQVYALLSLANDGGSITPDYSTSALDFYRDFVGHEITKNGFLDLILILWAPVERPKKYLGVVPTEGEHVSSWLAPLGDPPYGWPQEEVRSWRTRRNGEALVSKSSIYNASNNTMPNAYFGPIVNKKGRRRNGQTQDTTQARNQAESPQNMVLHVDGLKLGTVTDISARMADGLISRDALEMAGIPFTEGREALRNIPDATLQRLWRTLVADRDGSSRPAPMRFGLAFKNLFECILQLRSLDTVELLEGEGDPNIREFLERARDITWNRRVFLSTANEFQEKVLGLAPRGTCIGDTIAVLFGLSVPVILRPSSVGGGGYMEIVGAAYIDGKMEGEIMHDMGRSRMEELTETFEIV